MFNSGFGGGGYDNYASRQSKVDTANKEKQKSSRISEATKGKKKKRKPDNKGKHRKSEITIRSGSEKQGGTGYGVVNVIAPKAKNRKGAGRPSGSSILSQQRTLAQAFEFGKAKETVRREERDRDRARGGLPPAPAPAGVVPPAPPAPDFIRRDADRRAEALRRRNEVRRQEGDRQQSRLDRAEDRQDRLNEIARQQANVDADRAQRQADIDARIAVQPVVFHPPVYNAPIYNAPIYPAPPAQPAQPAQPPQPAQPAQPAQPRQTQRTPRGAQSRVEQKRGGFTRSGGSRGPLGRELEFTDTEDDDDDSPPPQRPQGRPRAQRRSRSNVPSRETLDRIGRVGSVPPQPLAGDSDSSFEVAPPPALQRQNTSILSADRSAKRDKINIVQNALQIEPEDEDKTPDFQRQIQGDIIAQAEEQIKASEEARRKRAVENTSAIVQEVRRALAPIPPSVKEPIPPSVKKPIPESVKRPIPPSVKEPEPEPSFGLISDSDSSIEVGKAPAPAPASDELSKLIDSLDESALSSVDSSDEERFGLPRSKPKVSLVSEMLGSKSAGSRETIASLSKRRSDLESLLSSSFVSDERRQIQDDLKILDSWINDVGKGLVVEDTGKLRSEKITPSRRIEPEPEPQPRQATPTSGKQSSDEEELFTYKEVDGEDYQIYNKDDDDDDLKRGDVVRSDDFSTVGKWNFETNEIEFDSD